MTEHSGFFRAWPLVIAGALFFSAGTASAAVQVKLPSCDAINAWSARVNLTDTYNVAPKLALPKAFQDADLVPVFGAPVLAWSQEDVQAVSAGLVACYQDAGKRRDAAAAAALANANRALLGFVPRTNATLQKAKTDAGTAKQQIDALPDSAELARAIDVLVHANPAAPDQNAYRPFQRPVVDPIWRLAVAVLNLADAERAPIYQALGERETKIQGDLSADAEKAVAGATNDAAGIITLMEARQKAAQIADADTKAKLAKSADDKAQQIRDALRQAKPAVWVPPSCLNLYRWSSAPNAAAGVNIAGHNMLMAFLDDRAVPVFGLSVSDWSDDDVAHFKTLRGLCQSASQPAAAAAGGPEAAELVQVASRGRWIEGADPQIADARTVMVAYHKAQEAMTADIAKIQALPDVMNSMVQMAQIVNDPALAALTQDDRNKVITVINAKRAAIAAQATDAAIKGLAGVKLASLGDLKNLFAYAAQTMPTIPDPRGQQAFRDAFNQSIQEATNRLLPDFKAKLASTPATLSGVADANMTLLQLEAASPQVANTPAYQTYFTAMQQSRDAQAASARQHACADFAASVGVSSGDAGQPLWDGHSGTTLGEFLCEIDEHGTVNSYSGPGMLSSTSTLKATPFKSQMFTVSLHKVEVQAGKTMLVGYDIKDAAQASGQSPTGTGNLSPTPNGPVTIEGWEIFVPDIIGLNGSEPEECMKTIDSLNPDSLAPAAKVFWLHCWTLDEVRVHEAKTHQPQH